VGELAGAAGPLGVADAETVVALGGLDLGKEHHHLGHGALPAGEHLGVADRLRERQPHRRESDGADPVHVSPQVRRAAV